VLREIAEKAAAAGLSRRAFLGLLGAAGGAAALAACTGSGSQAGRLRWGNWDYYIDTVGTKHPTLEQFEKESGIKVSYLTDIGDTDEFFGKVRGRLAAGQDCGYDLVCLNDWMAERWVRQGYTQAFDRQVMPNVNKNLLPMFASASYDVDRTHTIAWQGGYGGIAWNKEMVPEGIKSISDMWDPKFHGHVELFNEFVTTVSLVMWEQGTDPSSSWGDDEFNTALDVINKHIKSGQVVQLSDNAIMEHLSNGDAWVGVVYSGDVAQVNDDAGKEILGFAIPEAGGTTWADHFMVPKPSGAIEEAQKLVDFYYDPVVAATVAAYVQYITPVNGAQEAMEQIDPDLVDDPLIFPTEEILKTCPLVRGFSMEEYSKYTEQFLALNQT